MASSSSLIHVLQFIEIVFLQMLSEATHGMVNIIPGDVLHFDMHDLFEGSRRKNWDDIPPNIHLIGNLPFGVATPLIIKWLKAISEKLVFFHLVHFLLFTY